MKRVVMIFFLLLMWIKPSYSQGSQSNNCIDMWPLIQPSSADKFYHCTEDGWFVFQKETKNNIATCSTYKLDSKLGFIYFKHEQTGLKGFLYIVGRLTHPDWLLSKGDKANISIKLDKVTILNRAKRKISISKQPPLSYSFTYVPKMNTPGLYKSLKTAIEFQIRNFAHITIKGKTWNFPLSGTHKIIEKLKECVDSQ